MLRRPATLIPLTSNDVQELRELSTEQKAEALAVRTRLGKLMGVVEHPTLTNEDLALMKELTHARKQETARKAATADTGK